MLLKEVLEVVKNEKMKNYITDRDRLLPNIQTREYRIILNSENKLILEQLYNNEPYSIIIYNCYEDIVYMDTISTIDLKILNQALGFIEAKDALKEVMCFSEACEEWNISESALRMKVSRGTLKENEEYRKSGKKVNLITRAAMKKYYKKKEQ